MVIGRPGEFARIAGRRFVRFENLAIFLSMPFNSDSEIPDGAELKTESRFAKAIHKAFAETKPTRIIETGAYKGTGSTTIICSSILAANYPPGVRPKFYSIEINPAYLASAKVNTQKFRDAGVDLEFLHGVSVPRSKLPTPMQIEEMLEGLSAEIHVDHSPADRVVRYASEVGFDCPDAMLDQALDAFDHKPDFVLLDSAGHLGFVEFNYLIPRLAGLCWIALDDTNHLKHHQSLQAIKRDGRFKMEMESNERFGSCLCRFTP
jgi:hypothetical protein